MRNLGSCLLAMWLLWATAVAAEDRKCGVQQIAELKVTMIGNQPMIDVKINGAPVSFMVDSGAFYSVVTTAAARQLKLPLEPTNLHVKGVAGDADAYLTRVETLTLAETPIHRVPFVVASVGGGGAGLIGQNVLGLADVEYDLHHGAIRLFKPHDCGRISMAYWARGRDVADIPIDYPDERNPHTIGRAKLNGKDVRVIFDTGASTSFLTLDAAARAGVKPGDPGITNGGATGGVGGRLIPSYVGRFDSFQLDTEEVRNIRIRFGAMTDLADMLLGADFFISHRVYVANSQHRLYITYEGGPIFSTKATALERDAATHTEKAAAPLEDSGTEPTDADGFARRGAARLSAGEIAPALTDLDKAVEGAPDADAYRLLRARARLANHQPLMAATDLDLVLERHPANAEARLARARLRRSDGKPDLAMADLAAADAALAAEADPRLELGELYADLDAFAPARAAFSQWLKAHPDHPRRVVALAGRCRAQAFLGQDLDRAVGDCNRALDIGARNDLALEGRGLARLRQGKPDQALTDLQAALQARPKWPEAQYLRGLARTALGHGAEGREDQITALSTGPRLGERMKALGLAGPGPLSAAQ